MIIDLVISELVKIPTTATPPAHKIFRGLIVPSGAIGILAGGLILNKAKLSRKGAVLFVFGINFVIVGCMSSFFFLGCENPKIAGFTVPYPTGLSDGLGITCSM
ncbi:hypothetical protein ACTXT7_008998 [Hymenolepis weldensis]